MATADLGGKFNCMICNKLQTGVSSIGHGVVCYDCERKGYCKWCGNLIEFNLSRLATKKPQLGIDAEVYYREDIKKFIRLLKEEFGDYFFRDDMPNRYKDAIKIIDKLAGDRLK